MPVAGKTGTTQNWADAWAIGYSPYYTTAIWFGFDRPGNSLGVELTGATLTGPVWGDYMRELHQGLPRKEFARPASGVVDVTVCAQSGLLRTSFCSQGVTLPYLSGTQPSRTCTGHGNAPWATIADNMRSGTFGLDRNVLVGSLKMPSLPEDLSDILGSQNRNNRNTGNRNNPGARTPSSNPAANPSWSNNNPLLDGDDAYWFKPETESTESDNFFNRMPNNPLPQIEETERRPPERQQGAADNSPTTQNAQGDSSDFLPAGFGPAGLGPEIPPYNPLLD